MKNNSKATAITARCLAAVLMAAGVLFFAPAAPSYAESVIIGQAASGERGLSGNSAGDQGGEEVGTSSWTYSGSSGSPFHWNYVLRAKDPSLAKQIAANMKAAGENNHIGYDVGSPDRTSFYDAAKANDWDIAGITTNCETTCSCCVSVCLNAAGVDVPRNWASGAVPDDVMATGLFDCFTSGDYTASSAKLLPGDILVSSGHTAMVIESPNLFEFEVKYVDVKGEEQTTKIEEGKSIEMNLNNGTEVKSIKIEDTTDLGKYEPEKKNASFAGWKLKDGDVFVASYRPKVMSIATESKKIKIKD